MPQKPLSPSEIETLVSKGIAPALATGRRTLIIIPDATRSAPIPAAFTAINRLAAEKKCHVDYLIALGTHPALSPAEIGSLVGMPLEQIQNDFPGTKIWNHNWMDKDQLVNLGTILADEVDVLSSGLMKEAIPVKCQQAHS